MDAGTGPDQGSAQCYKCWQTSGGDTGVATLTANLVKTSRRYELVLRWICLPGMGFEAMLPPVTIAAVNIFIAKGYVPNCWPYCLYSMAATADRATDRGFRCPFSCRYGKTRWLVHSGNPDRDFAIQLYACVLSIDS